MSKLGTINGVAVISAVRVPWKPDDDETVKALCDARGLVMFDGGGASNAICLGDIAIVFERGVDRFRAFPLPPRPAPSKRDLTDPDTHAVIARLMATSLREAAKLQRGEILDETPGGTSSDAIVIAREVGYREGWNAAKRETARGLDATADRWAKLGGGK